MWSKWIIEGDLTLEQFLEALKSKYSLVADTVLVGQHYVYDTLLAPDKSQANMKRLISEMYVQDAGLKLSGRDMIRVTVLCGRDVETPNIYLKYK